LVDGTEAQLHTGMSPDFSKLRWRSRLLPQIASASGKASVGLPSTSIVNIERDSRSFISDVLDD
jgi:hypothetical protein